VLDGTTDILPSFYATGVTLGRATGTLESIYVNSEILGIVFNSSAGRGAGFGVITGGFGCTCTYY
jgi:hypothetical protein